MANSAKRQTTIRTTVTSRSSWRIRVDEPHAAPLRKRAKRFWKKNRRWLIPLVILTVGILVIWLSLRVVVGDAMPRQPA